MKANRRFSLLPLPQFYDGSTLSLNILVLPRNQNPLKPAIEQNDPPIPDAAAFADARWRFEARVVSGLSTFPHRLLATATVPLTTVDPTQARDLFQALGKNFQIANLNQTNENLAANADKADAARPVELSVQKYLPLSYRRAFNFTTPRTRNAKIDDSYHCAVRSAGKVPGFKRSPDEISWGKVFAFALRQPLLARQLGMIYETQLEIDPAYYPQGGWLYLDLAADSDYKTQQNADDDFVRRYAVRIPVLKEGEARQVFAPILFPVLFKNLPGDPDPQPDGNYDQLFIETASYDDGFARIVHAHQPHSRNLLLEESDGAHPVKDVGIRLGWDDEQILIWYMRQLSIDPTVTDPDKRIEAPLGVHGYAIDVREATMPESMWESLNEVESKAALTVGTGIPDTEPLSLGSYVGELPYQVYPMQLDGNSANSYWLPIYFANWTGKSMVLPDQDAAEIYQTTSADVKADPLDPINNTGTGVSGPAQNQLSKIYSPAALATALRYGKQYQFRVRLRDLSGGGPPLLPSVAPINESASAVATCRFKRYVAPNQPRLERLPVNTDLPNDWPSLTIRRPLLGYPAVVYTGKYADPVTRLIAASKAMAGVEAFGIPDPDVDRVLITVEIKTLEMDKLLSVSGKDNYVHLYTTSRAFPAVNNDDDYDAPLEVPIVYTDCKVLRVTPDEINLVEDLGLSAPIDDLTEIVLPTGRTARITIRAFCEEKTPNDQYYGLLGATPEKNNRYGQTIEVACYRPSVDETDLFVDEALSKRLQGIYLQPDPGRVIDGTLATLLLGKEKEKAPDLIQRLAKQLDLESNGLTLMAPKGERVLFGCSNRIRHTLSPEGSSITFSSKGDLMNHWLGCLNVTIDRDWTWDALAGQGFVVKRTKRFTDDANAETETGEVGDIEIKRTISFESQQNPQRNYTRLIFIDAVEPKNTRMQPPPNDKEPRFPDTIEVSYSLIPQFKPGHGVEADPEESLSVTLPITTPPAQIPRIVSAGIALSPYQRNEKYSATETRRRYLWIELAEPIKDPQDSFFARMLAYAPDQLISNNHPELFVAPEEPALPIDPEYIRVITAGATNDLAGLNAMQPMEKALDSDRHYLLPLPPGLHADAAEMFGFFTYEFRCGHYRNAKTDEMVWCTAQGRFGRPLRVTGLQHPAPALTCMVNRDEEKLYVMAPYAAAVFNGKDVTADPPRTSLWCLLYAQVRQADNADNRNLLLDDKQLDWRIQIEQEKNVNWFARYDDDQRRLLKHLTIRNWKDDLSYANSQHVFKLATFDQTNQDATKYGTVVWSNLEIRQLLELYGLPLDSSLSVLVVEMLPNITNIYEHVSGLGKIGVNAATREQLQVADLPEQGAVQERTVQMTTAAMVQEPASPLSDRLGHHRILRTSPLTEVPFVCCTGC